MYTLGITETIAHFIGIFEISLEEARGREAYDEFRAHAALAEEEAELKVFDPNLSESYTLVDVSAQIRYFPGFDPLVLIDISTHASANYVGVPLSNPWYTTPGRLSPPHSSASGGTGRPALEIDPPGSIGIVAVQSNFATDHDILTMGDVEADWLSTALFDQATQSLREQASLIDPIAPLTRPDSEGAVSRLADQLLAELAEPTPAGDEMAEVHTHTGSGMLGIHVNGAAVDEGPDFADYRPPEADEEEAENAPFVAGAGELDFVASMELGAGHNVLINEVFIGSSWTVSPVFAVVGDSVTINAIVQTNVWSDSDRIDATFASWADAESVETTALNIASFVVQATTPEDSGEQDGPTGFPSHWVFTTITGNLSLINWIEQYNYLSDHDIITVTARGSKAVVEAGGNVEFNTFSLLELGFYYDLVVVGGSIYHVNLIEQQNILFDNDIISALPGFQTTGSASLATDGNLLWNEARIHVVGQSDFQAMPDHFRTAAEGLANDDPGGLAGVLHDDAFAGMSALRVLYVSGNILDLQYISQTNVLGDADQISVFGEGIEGFDDTDWSITTGGNDLINSATIYDSGVDSTLYVGGDVYSEALLYQAELISDEPLPLQLAAASDSLANEAVLFLADGMLEIDSAEPETIVAPTSDVVSVDPMQTMLA
ncbi:hypothetical protein [Mesorhizobium sp. 10J20-29]